MSEGEGLPNGWVEVRIEDTLIPQSNGKVFQHGWSPQCEKHASPSHDIWGVLKTTAIQPGVFLDEHNKELPSKLKPRPHLEVREGDMLITCAGPRVRCGVPAFVRTSRPRLIISGKMYRFRGHHALVEPRFLEAFLLSTDAQAAIDAMKTGISDSGLNLTHDRFANLKVKLAPLNEQLGIADRIDELFTDLSAGVAALERVQKKLTRYRSAVLHAAVTGRLTDAWRKEHGPPAESGEQLLERLLVERRRQWEEWTLAEYEAQDREPPKNWRQRYIEPVEPKTDDLPELPEGWCWASQDQVGEVQLGRQRSPQHHSGEHMRPYLRVANVFEDRISTRDVKSMNFTPREFETYELRHGDLLLNEGQSMELIGRPAMYRGEIPGCCFQNTLVRQRVCLEVSPDYALNVLLAQFKTGRYRKIARITTSIAHLGAERFAALEFPLPPIAEQQAIVELVQEKFSQIDAMEAEVTRGLARAARLRQAILKAAFAGKLVPQDPKDEPVSVLLERIRAEREATAAQSNARPKRATRKKAAPMKKVTKSVKRKSTKKKATKS